MMTTTKGNEIGSDLVIARKKRRATCNGTWAIGTLNGYRFQALVFPEHAECSDFELHASRISKLWLKRTDNGETMANFDRGWDIRPRTKHAGRTIEFLAANLADLVYTPEPQHP